MFVIMGGTGHVGSACAEALLARGEPVTVVTREASHAEPLAAKGAEIAEADVCDVDALRAAFRRGRRAFLLNPPADVAGDTDGEERATVAAILAALEGSGLEKVVAASVSGARPGERIGDLGVLWQLEEGLRRQPIPAAVNHGGYYFSNWATQLAAVHDTGLLSSMLPGDLVLPMVAPRDLGLAAAQRLLSPIGDVGARDVEGPGRYTPAQVAAAFSDALGRPVELEVIPRDAWVAAFRRIGFSDAAADAYAGMTAATVDGDVPELADPIRGDITLESYIAALVAAG